MGVGLFTAGIVLNTLGISDYGIYNIVGGFVSMFGFLSTSMSTATQRFMSFDIGKKDFIQLRKTFSTTVSIHFVIGVIIVLILETFGLWYINNKLNVSDERIYAANIVFQFSVLTSFFSILQVPYNALITAHEKFKIYAYIGFLDTAFKLIILYFLKSVSYDKLILYSFLLFLSSFIIRMIYRIYCRRNFPESHYFLYFDRAYFKTLLSFTGWNLIGNIADVARGQGNNLLLNIFFGTVMNAAYGITLQVQNLVKIFITNFQKSVNPQIVKSYANNENQRTIFLIKESAKLSFFMMILIAMPIIYNLNFILTLWLREFPVYTLDFIYLSLSTVLIDTISNPLMMGAGATGKIKWYQIIVGSLTFLSFPISYLGLRIFPNPNIIYVAVLLMSIITLFFRLYFLKRMIKLDISEFLLDVLLKIIICTCLILIWHYIIYMYLGKASSLFSLILNSFLSILGSSLTIYFFGLNKHEINFIKSIKEKYI